MGKKEFQLMERVNRFIEDNEIDCAESIYQMDCVIENAPDFIEDLCNIAGYYKLPKEE